MTNEQRHAHELYFQTQLTQQQIAEMLDINRKTLYLWIKEGGWKHAKYAAAHAPSVLIEQYYEQLGAINNHIASRTEQAWPSKEEAVTIRSLTTTIKNIRNGKHTVGESVEVFQHFTDKLRRKDLLLTKEILPHMTKHIKDLSEEGQWLNFSQLRFEQEAFDKEYETWVAQQESATPHPASTSPAPLEVYPDSTTPPSPLERACPAPLAGAGERSLAQDTTPPALQTPLSALNTPPAPLERACPTPLAEAGERSLAQDTTPPAPQTPLSALNTPPAPLERACPAPLAGAGVRLGASNGASPLSENPAEPAPMAEMTQNDNADLSTKNDENVDNFSPEMTTPEPAPNNMETKDEEEIKEPGQPKLLYPEDRWAIFLEERYKISQDPFVTRRNGITVIKSGSPLWNRGRGQSLFF